jgi:hypothetical protein
VNDRRVVAAVWFNEAVCEIWREGGRIIFSSATLVTLLEHVSPLSPDDGLAACRALNTSVFLCHASRRRRSMVSLMCIGQ